MGRGVRDVVKHFKGGQYLCVFINSYYCGLLYTHPHPHTHTHTTGEHLITERANYGSNYVIYSPRPHTPGSFMFFRIAERRKTEKYTTTKTENLKHNKTKF